MQIIKISSKNQVTIPKKTLEKLGFGKKAILETEKGVIKILPMGDSVVEEVAGSLKTYVKKSKLGSDLKTINDITTNKAVRELASK
jgi:bifunctional DNA-binding transcriptional regulator/antitoxin component of YhaV-PrlF toxin-antitoxin module